uniref:rho GTPase-activating protein 12-like isoform X1 n=1 Tax=Styela clava TaxID=7725 RepID=UPI00193A2600|nr:rho GTPase-activating protein 12-like isoform X1 [Styela clava]
MSRSINANDLGRVVRVEYDYTYKSNDGRNIKITEGEEYVLIKKSNEDWWQVVKKEQKKPMYVPAAYVKEMQQKRFLDHPFFKKAHNAVLKSQKKESDEKRDDSKPKKTVKRLSDGPTSQASKERMIVVTGSREDLSVLSGFSHTSKFSEMRASTDSLDKFIENENPYDIVPLEPLARPKEKKTQVSSRLQVKPSDAQNDEDPDYENLSDFVSTSPNAAYQQPDKNSTTNMDSKKSGSKSPPAVSKKPSFRRPDLPDSNTHVYANLQGKSAIKPAMPSHHSPQSSTLIEVIEDGWELHLDNDTGNRYYYNPASGSMSTKPPRRSTDSLKKSQKTSNITEQSSPEPAPRSHNKSPLNAESKRVLRPSPLQRRKTSPARFKNPGKAPFMQSRIDRKSRKDEENTEPNENNSNNFLVADELSSSPVRGSEKQEDSLPSSLPHNHSRGSSATSRSLSPSAAVSPYNPVESPSPTPAGWVKETNVDGDTVLINSVNGERWNQFFDTDSGSFYYCNEVTRVTLWDLPLIENLAQSNTTKGGDIENSAETPKSRGRYSAKHERSSSGPHDSPSALRDARKSSIRKSKTLDRDSYLPTADGEFGDQKSKSSSLPWPKKKAPKSPPTPPSANLKPRKGRTRDKNANKRMLHSQSMILLDGNTHSAKYASPFHQDESDPSEATAPGILTGQRNLFAPPPHPMIERQGRLNWTKLAEAGKKIRKNWVQLWVVLLSNNLLFYKDQKQAHMTKANPLGKPESSCELRGACVEWAKEKSSKKNVFEVSTVRGFCFLLQQEDEILINEWYKSINTAINRANNIEPLDQSLMPRKDSHGSTEDEGMENNNHLDVKDKKKKDKDKKKDKKGKPPSRHGSDARQSDKVRSKLKKFIGRRPTMESLQERGLIKETVFGCPLDKLCDKQGTNIPYFVKSCVEEVEKRGLNIDGIYRVSGNLSHVQKLRYTVDREIPVNFSDPEWEDIHVITGALKMFLRELPEPVIPFTFFDKFIATCKISDKNSRHDATKSLIRALPKPNKETLKYLLLHFCKVVEHSESNRMQVQNIAIVFGPTLLLKPPELTNHHDPGGGHMAVYMMYQNQIIDYMLSEFKALF